MSPAAVRVTTPSRLHFGMLSFGQSGVRQFGGVGLMIAEPRIRLQITAADRIEAVGPLADRAVQFARRVSENLGLTHSTGCRIELDSAPREHVGLGTGTQLGLAIAAGLRALHSLPPVAQPDRLTLARWLVDRRSPTTARSSFMPSPPRAAAVTGPAARRSR